MRKIPFSKLLLFIKTPPPITGATLMNQRLYNSESLRDHFDVRSVLSSYSKNLGNLGKMDLSKALQFLKAFVLLFRELLLHRPQLVYFQISPTGVAFFRDSFFVLLMKMFRVKIVFHLRGRGVNRQAAKMVPVRWYYKRIFMKTWVICLSELLTGDISSVYAQKPFVVHNGIPVVENYFDRDFTALAGRLVKILFLSNLIVSKGVLDFIKSIKCLTDHGHRVKGIIVGGEAELNAADIRNLMTEYHLENVLEYRGPLYGVDKQRVLGEADIFVFPTYYEVEAFPGVLLEAMQFELPVVTTRECSIPIIVKEKVTGLFVEKQSPGQIADCVKQMIEDFELFKAMGTNGRKRFLDEFTFARYERNMIQIFDSILGESLV